MANKYKEKMNDVAQWKGYDDAFGEGLFGRFDRTRGVSVEEARENILVNNEPAWNYNLYRDGESEAIGHGVPIHNEMAMEYMPDILDKAGINENLSNMQLAILTTEIGDATKDMIAYKDGYILQQNENDNTLSVYSVNSLNEVYKVPYEDKDIESAVQWFNEFDLKTLDAYGMDNEVDKDALSLNLPKDNQIDKDYDNTYDKDDIIKDDNASLEEISGGVYEERDTGLTLDW